MSYLHIQNQVDFSRLVAIGFSDGKPFIQSTAVGNFCQLDRHATDNTS
jgi:hypothetical protein